MGDYIPMRQVTRLTSLVAARLLSLAGLLGLSACASSAEIEKLGKDFEQYKQSVETRFRQHEMALGLLREEDKKIWRNLHCSDPQIADFMAEAEQCQRGQCPQRNLDRVLGFMASQKHVLIRLRPNQAAADMAPSRVAQLRDVLEARQLTSLSRVLMLTMQLNQSRDSPADLAERQADALLVYTRQILQLAFNVPRIGPFPVTCQNKTQLLDGYARRFPADRPVAGEPKPKEPQVAIWIFKVDC